MNTSMRVVVLATLVVLVAAAAWIGSRYSSDLRAAHARAAAGSTIAATRCGPVEYASAGTGPVVLIVHGAGGGHDQGMMLAPELVASGYRVVAMSRFGYLRTPAPLDVSPQAQADAHACLLDALGISRAAVVGVSAGALSSLQFAIRHPGRCSALVLLVPLTYRPAVSKTAHAPPAFPMRLALRALESDFVFWALTELAPAFVTRTVLGTPPQLEANATPAERDRLAAVRHKILPVSLRAEGLRIEALNAATMSRYELETIRAPALIVGLQDDLYDTYEGARYTAQHVPGARFMSFESGGHLWIGHQEEILAAVVRFVRPA